MDGKLILKASLITIASLIVAVALSFTLWFFLAPGSMASISQQWGYYDFALTCANKQYNKSQKTGDLAFCAEISIYLADDELVIKYCEPLTERDDFGALCSQKDEALSNTQYGAYATNYRSYILGNLAVSQYRNGDLKKAVETAEQGVGTSDNKEVIDACFKRLVLEIALHGTDADTENVIKYITRSDIGGYVDAWIKGLTQAG